MAQSVKPDTKQLTRFFSTKKEKDMLALSSTTNIAFNVLMVIGCILTLFPIYVIVIASITSEASLT